MYHGSLTTYNFKKITMNTRYILLALVFLGITACNEIEDVLEDNNIVINQSFPELNTGTADFSNYVAVGASFSAGFTDGALFKAAQENSFTNMLAKEFAKVGGGDFKQPLMNDNIGGLLFNNVPNSSFEPRLFFNGAPTRLPATPTTEVFNILPGPFQNIGVPGAKSFHMIAPGYGNPAGLLTVPATSNPYFVRMASSPTASMIGDAIAQNPSFFTLSLMGGNDVLDFAFWGGANSTSITDSPTFDFAFTKAITDLTAGGAKGVVTNVPYIENLPYFSTVPHNPLSPSNPSFGPLIPTLNGVFGQLNQVFAFLGVPERSIIFSETDASPVVIWDESLPNISTQITGVLLASPTFPAFVQSFGLPAQAAPLVATLFGNIYGQTRQANENDILVLLSSTVIGTVNESTFAFFKISGTSR